jgi:hypothetical protein
MVEQKDFTANTPPAASGGKHLSLRGDTARVNEGLGGNRLYGEPWI